MFWINFLTKVILYWEPSARKYTAQKIPSNKSIITVFHKSHLMSVSIVKAELQHQANYKSAPTKPQNCPR